MQPEFAVPAGWYDDPTDPTLLRWWDGLTWADHICSKQEPVGKPHVAVVPPAASGPVSARVEAAAVARNDQHEDARMPDAG